MFACDFETRNEDPASVWHWGIMKVSDVDEWYWGTDIESFMKEISKLNTTIYFHNLRFDGSFIVSWLLSNGFKYNKERKHKTKTFKTLISRMNQWYSIEICFSDNKNNRHVVKIHDSMKKIPGSIESIAKNYQLPLLKGEIDYNKKRPIGYEPTKKEIEYLYSDLFIMARALDIQFKNDLTKMTIGSDCLNQYKYTLHSDKKKAEQKYRKLFPIINDEVDEWLRKAYRGGWTYLKSDHQEKDLGKGIIMDVNSEYPYVMRHKLMPYGKPIRYVGKYEESERFPLYVQQLKCSFEVKKDHLPTIQIKKSLYFRGNEYLKSSDGLIVPLTLSSIDLELFFKHYHVRNIEWIGGFMFAGAYGLYNDYIDKYVKLKMDSAKTGKNPNPTNYAISKLMLNNLYGKTGSNPDVTGKYPVMDEDGVVRLRFEDPERTDPEYIPTAIFTTSYARELIITASQDNYDRFIYCDTDSVHLIGTEIPDNLKEKIHPTKLGYFDLENTFDRARYLYQKTYIYETTNKNNEKVVSVKGAGMTEDVKENLNFDNFYTGVTVPGLKKGKTVRGGTMIEDGMFTIKDRFRLI